MDYRSGAVRTRAFLSDERRVRRLASGRDWPLASVRRGLDAVRHRINRAEPPLGASERGGRVLALANVAALKTRRSSTLARVPLTACRRYARAYRQTQKFYCRSTSVIFLHLDCCRHASR